MFKNKYQGVTEYLSKKENKKNNGVMLIFSNNLSVSPITKHVPIDQVSKKINKDRINADIYKLSNSERVREIAILISGQKVTESSRKQAEELLQLNG